MDRRRVLSRRLDFWRRIPQHVGRSATLGSIGVVGPVEFKIERAIVIEAGPLSEAEVRDLILTFWRLNAEQAPASEFAPIVDDDFALVAVDANGEEVLRFDGMRGLEEHQAGKEVYFDQRFTLRSFVCELQGDQAIAKTTGLWECIHREPGMAAGEALKADLAHTWRARRSPETGRSVLSLHVCTYFQYLPGFGPAQAHDDASTDREFHLDFDRHWTTTDVG